jgi:hypothetical protein
MPGGHPGDSRHVSSRPAPAGLTLSVPWHLMVAGIGLGICTALLGFVYLAAPPPRPAYLADVSVVAVLEPVLGWVFLAIGTCTVVATLTSRARASVHGLAAVSHASYMLALVITVVLTKDGNPPHVAAVLSGPAFIAHAALSVSYWQRGYR